MLVLYPFVPDDEAPAVAGACEDDDAPPVDDLCLPRFPFGTCVPSGSSSNLFAVLHVLSFLLLLLFERLFSDLTFVASGVDSIGFLPDQFSTDFGSDVASGVASEFCFWSLLLILLMLLLLIGVFLLTCFFQLWLWLLLLVFGLCRAPLPFVLPCSFLLAVSHSLFVCVFIVFFLFPFSLHVLSQLVLFVVL